MNILDITAECLDIITEYIYILYICEAKLLLPESTIFINNSKTVTLHSKNKCVVKCVIFTYYTCYQVCN